MNSLLPPGAQLGPYELLLPLPRTGAAQVYIARFHGAGAFRTRVTVKTIPRSYLDDLPTEHLLREQTALAAQIRHPNLVEVLDMGEHDDTLYVAMEWVDGEPLQALLSESVVGGDAMPLALAVNLAGQACRGLHAIHEFRDLKGLPAGAVHGHVSPQNLLLSYNGTVKVSDFGIARAMDRISFLTRATQQHNKLTFVAPEQLSARPVDARSDVFSVGTLLYLLTTGRHPFGGADVRETLNNICSAESAPPPGDVLPGYRDELGAVISKALRKAPEERWGSALEFLNALERAMPACFHATSEQCLATYLERFFAAHKIALHARLHAAEQQQDKRRSVVPEPRPRQHSSLRAVALDALDAPELESAPATQRSAREIRAAAMRRAVGKSLGLTLAIALPFLFALGFGLWFELTPGRESNASAALASQPPLGNVSTVKLEPLPQPTLEPPPEPTRAASAPSAPPSPAPIDVSQLPPERSPVAAIPAPRAKAAEAARARAAASAAAAAAPAATRMNAWDPSTFGGRH